MSEVVNRSVIMNLRHICSKISPKLKIMFKMTERIKGLLTDSLLQIPGAPIGDGVERDRRVNE